MIFWKSAHLHVLLYRITRPLRECDILTPDQGRQVAKEMNAPYYESSVLTGHGVKEVFENVIRSALISRRHQRFWMTNLKHVRNCLLQEPYCPPRPLSPQLKVPESQYEKDMRSLLSRQAYTDVVFVHNAASVHCHKIVMVAASDIFHTLFTYHHYNQMSKAHTSNSTNSSTSSSTSSTDRALTKCASDISIASSMDEFDRQKHKLFNDDSLLDVRMSRQLKNLFSASILFPLLNFDTSKLFKHSFAKHHKLFSCSKVSQSKHRFKLLQQKLITVYKNVKDIRSDEFSALKSKSKSVISFGTNIPFNALKSYILLLYSFKWSSVEGDAFLMDNLTRCLRYLDLVQFNSFTTDYDELLCKLKKYIDEVKCGVFAKRFVFFGIEKGLFSGTLTFFSASFHFLTGFIDEGRCDF